MRIRNQLLMGAAVAIVACGAPAASASTVGWWRMEDGAAGTTANTIASQVNAAAMEGVAHGTGVRAFSGDVAGPYIHDPISGNTYANATSVFTDINGGFKVAATGQESLLEPASFTIEMFIKGDLAQNPEFKRVIQKEQSGFSPTWQLDMRGTERRLAVRTDHSGTSNDTVTSDANGVFVDSQWHHIAAVYDADGGPGGGGRFQLYVDYTLVATLNLANDGELIYNGKPLFIGDAAAAGNGFTGLMDEVRFTSGTLSTSQFLQVAAIPEPAGLALLAGLATVIRRRSSRG